MIRDPRLTSVKNSVPNKNQATQSASALKAAACASLNDTGIASDFTWGVWFPFLGNMIQMIQLEDPVSFYLALFCK